MASERKFVHKALEDYSVTSFIERQLSKAGISSISIQRTPVATRITMQVQKPGMVVGKRGAGINELVELLKQSFGIENPQIEVLEVPVPSLDAKLVAEKIGRQIGLRGNIKQVMRMALQEIMSAGALGAEIRIAGKVVGKGGKAKTLTARAGFLKKSGNLTKLVRVAKYTAYPKAGAIGVRVRILPPGVVLSDKIDVESIKLPEAPAPAAIVTQERENGSESAEPKQEASAEAEKVVEQPTAPKKRGRKKKQEQPTEAKQEAATQGVGEATEVTEASEVQETEEDAGE